MAFDTAPSAPGPPRPTDQDGHTAADDLVAAQRESMQRVLKEIEAAFTRLADGEYGVCRGCATPIPAERLEILPYTPHCVGCRRRSV